MKAYCWASGLIEFGRKKPDGAILIAEGPAKPLRDVVEPIARMGQGQSEGKLLVPGVPEADLFGWDPVDMLVIFCKRVAVRADKHPQRDKFAGMKKVKKTRTLSK